MRSTAYVLSRFAICLLLMHTLAAGTIQNFGQVALGSTQSLTLTYSFTGLSGPPSFSLAWNRDFSSLSPTCTVAATITCSVTVTFNPLRPGLRLDTLIAKDQSANVLATTPIQGVGLSPLMVFHPGIISTLAGNGIWGYQDSPIPATAEFRNPQGVALDGSANALYVADSINGVIRKIVLSSGAVTTVAGNGSNSFGGDNGPATSALLNAPTGVTVDSAGNLYIADQGNNLIRRVDANTQIITTVAGGGTTASGNDVYGDGGPATSAILYGPQSVAVDPAGNLFIADTYHQLVRMVSAATGIISIVAGGGTGAGTDGVGDSLPATNAILRNPMGVGIDGNGDLYIADTGNNLIRRVDMTSGIISAVAGNGNWGYSGDSGPATSARLASPQGVALDSANNIYVADYGNNAIRQISAASQIISTLAGRVSTGYYGDGGNPTLAFLTSPTSVAVDENGNLFLADYGNNVVREISYAPVPLSFGSVNVGAMSQSQVVSPVNIGNQPLNLSNLLFIGDFQQVSAGVSDCASGTVLAPAATCDTGISFVPTQTGELAGSLQLISNSLNAPSAVAAVGLSGIGAPGAGPLALLSVSSLTFAAQPIGVTSTTQTVTLTNTGGSPFSISSIWLAGPAASDFTMTTTCGSSQAPSASCTVSIAFTPTSNGTRSATLLISDLVAGSPQTVALTGTGSGGIAQFSAISLNFSSVVGLASTPQTVTLSNTGSYPLLIIGASVGGSNATDFQLSSNCGSTLAAGASCAFSVAFLPIAAGNRSATLSIFNGSESLPRNITLTGTATLTIPSSGLRFVPVTPCRIADTRSPTGPFGGPILSGGVPRSFVVPNSACGIPSSAQAYSLNFTVVPVNSLSYLTVWPAGQPQPLVSLLNSDGRIKANAAILQAGSLGAISVYGSEDTHLIVDINGYFVPATNSAALAFYPLTPCRIADTRSTTPIAGGQTRNFSPLSSSCGIPASAQAYSLNLTAIPKQPIGFLATWPAGQPQPLVSTLNTSTVDITANAAIVPAGSNGDISVYSTNTTDLAVDVNGYFAPATTSGALSLFTFAPCRVLDTRLTSGAFSGTIVVNLSGSSCAVPSSAQAYVLNATVVPSTGLSFLSLWQNGAPWPTSSILNATDNAITSNMAVVPTTNGSIDSLATDPTELILDVASYFAP